MRNDHISAQNLPIREYPLPPVQRLTNEETEQVQRGNGQFLIHALRAARESPTK